jgi:hypothetical protein
VNVTAVILVLAQAAQPAAPSASPAPPKTIIHLKTTPFCDVFRDNVFHAVEGLRGNDAVIDQAQLVMAKWTYDTVAESGGGPSIKMDQYQLGLVVQQVAHNLQLVQNLLNAPDRFPVTPQSDADRDLLKIRATLQTVADSQERTLNILSGMYETSALNALLSLGNNTAGALQQGSIPDKNLQLGDPILTSPGFSPPPVFSNGKHVSLFASTPVGRIHTAVIISQRLTATAENQVAPAIMPGVARCRGE